MIWIRIRNLVMFAELCKYNKTYFKMVYFRSVCVWVISQFRKIYRADRIQSIYTRLNSKATPMPAVLASELSLLLSREDGVRTAAGHRGYCRQLRAWRQNWESAPTPLIVDKLELSPGIAFICNTIVPEYFRDHQTQKFYLPAFLCWPCCYLVRGWI